MGKAERPHPGEVRDAAEFAAALRGLKEWAGLTYRQLEARAVDGGDTLPRSTLADVLRGRTSPRPELLAAFVRACGDGERVALWLRACADVHERREAPAGGAPERPGPAGQREKGRGVRHRRPVLLAAVAVGVLGGLGLAVASEGAAGGGDGGKGAVGGGDRGRASTSAERGRVLPNGWVRISVTHVPGLCLTDGRVPHRRFTPMVAVQRPCDDVAPQGTTLEKLGGDRYRIRWHHPDYGVGCLKALTEGPGKGLLEPWDDCDLASQFHIEPSEPYGSDRYVFRVAGQGCVGIKASSRDEGTEAVMQRCVGKAGQVFRVQRAP